MSKEKTKTVEEPVGATISRPHFEGITKNKKGITLIALIITIIVMLILVGVTVSVSLNGGLFNTAKQVTGDTQNAVNNENQLAGGRIQVNGIWYNSIEDYTNNVPGSITPEPTPEPPAIMTEIAYEDLEEEASAEIKAAVDAGKIAKVLKETKGEKETIAVIPTGFEVSTEIGEDTISGGLVIKDSNNNEFVWIPVTNAASYAEDSFGPLTDNYVVSDTTIGKYDSYQTIQYLYGNALGEITDDASFNATFTYAEDKTNIEENIQTYGGFYVGRYETTIEGTTIGVQAGKTVLTAKTLLKEGTNTTSNDEYHYRWWGLYKAQKDMYANNQSVGSLMISSKQWDEIMTFTGYRNTTRARDTYTTKPDLSGSAYVTDNTQYDVSKNIYDLAGNVCEVTLRELDDALRVRHGGNYFHISGGIYGFDFPDYSGDFNR